MVEKNPVRRAVTTWKLPAVLAFGNPLLDITVLLKTDNLLKRYNFNLDDEMEISEKQMQELMADVSSELEQQASAGGSALNTMRVLQWLCDITCRSCVGVYYGGLGNDSVGVSLQSLVQASGVDVRYAIHPVLPTGICVSLINGTSRTLVANLGAASVYTLNDLRKNDLPLDMVKIIYIEGFFITHSLDVAKEVVKQASEKQIIVAFNLNGEYIFKEHHAAICEMVGLAKIVFGNVKQMIALAQALDVKYDEVTDIPFLLNSLKRITIDVSSACAKDWLCDDSIFVMTQGGSGPAIIVWGEGESAQIQPITPPEPIVDTTGAGDALVAGFLAGVLSHWDPFNCLEYGCKVASFMTTRQGVTLPKDVPPHLLS